MSKKILFSFIASALFLSGCAAPAKIQKIINAAVTPTTAPVSVATETTPSVSQTVVASTSSISVHWQKPEPMASLGLFFPSESYTIKNKIPSADHYEDATNYYSVGNLIYNGEPGQLILVAASPVFGDNDLYFFVSGEKTLTLLQKISSSLDKDVTSTRGNDGLDRTKFTIDSTADISGLRNFPSVITGNNPRQSLNFEGVVEYWGVSTTFKNAPVFVDTQGRSLYSNNRNSFFMTDGTPLVAEYALQPDFFDKDSLVPLITWNNGEKNTAEYSYVGVGGCGSYNFLQVVDQKDINVSTDLVMVGKNNQSDPVYELKDTNHRRLKDLYDNFPTEPKLTYEQFLATRPLLYWVDPFGRLVELQNKKFQPQAECGKPVIYLYPQKIMKVSVKVEPKGGLTYSEPKLNDGWEVEAKPNGDLTETKTGRYYPYLFWEGRGDIYEQPKLGWMVKQAGVKQFLKTKLAALGLTRSETNDFLDFWLPKMREKPYYFVTFLGNATMDKLAPLIISPEPDTVIRILMDFTPLDKPIVAKGFTVRTPKRKGFTVIEWGGVVR